MDDWKPLPKPTPEDIERMKEPGGLLWWAEQGKPEGAPDIDIRRPSDMEAFLTMMEGDKS